MEYSKRVPPSQCLFVVPEGWLVCVRGGERGRGGEKLLTDDLLEPDSLALLLADGEGDGERLRLFRFSFFFLESAFLRRLLSALDSLSLDDEEEEEGEGVRFRLL